MRSYSAAETCMLLLFAPIAEGEALGRSAYKRLLRTMEALGTGGDPEEALTEGELLRLGAGSEEAKRILARLDQREALERHLSVLDRLGITVLTRLSPEYPRRLRQVLGQNAPMLLYCAGNLSLFGTRCMALVGSRQLRQPGRDFAAAAGRAMADQGFTYVSGGAVGADTAGFAGAVAGQGNAILFLADSLEERMGTLRRELAAGQLLLVSEYGYDHPFSAGRAMSRNRLIHAMGEKVFIAQSDYGGGGTWSGVMENLKAGWSPCYICNSEPEDPGTVGLTERGCVPVDARDLKRLEDLRENQTSLF